MTELSLSLLKATYTIHSKLNLYDILALATLSDYKGSSPYLTSNIRRI